MRLDGMVTYEQIETELDRFRGHPPRSSERLSRQLRSILQCIHTDPFAPELNVQEVKERCQVRDNNISCRFRYILGTTIKDYIEELRMRAACHLLTTTAVCVFDIAMSVGYLHPQTFYKVFRRRFACSPTSYREQDPPHSLKIPDSQREGLHSLIENSLQS